MRKKSAIMSCKDNDDVLIYCSQRDNTGKKHRHYSGEHSDTTDNIVQAKEKLKSGHYSTLYIDFTHLDMAAKELMDWTGINCPEVTAAYLVRKISPDVTVEKWRVDSNAMFRHICGHQDPLTLPLNSLFDGVSKTTWVSIVMREFIAAREKTEKNKGHFALIIGAAGTGKYTLAQIAHCRSAREDNPFLFVNCKAEGKMNPVIWSESEREQFRQNVRNIMTLAQNGTLYFREIDYLDIEIQRELADILKTGLVAGVNGNTLEKFNGIIICSTRHNLEELVEIDECAEELFQLINENVVRIPSISDFKDEIVTLANDFVRHICLYYNIECKELTNDAKRMLSEHVWGRNIRELYETVKHAVDLCGGKLIKGENIRFEKIRSSDDAQNRKCRLKRALIAAEGCKVKAAELLGITRKSVHSWIREFNLPADYGKPKYKGKAVVTNRIPSKKK